MTVVKAETAAPKRTPKQNAANALRQLRAGIEDRIVQALAAHDSAAFELAMRDVEVGRLLNEYRATFTTGKPAEQAAAFNAQAERITKWAYPTFRRVMQAATTADRIPGAAEAVKGSIHALAALSPLDVKDATEVLQVHADTGEVPTAKTIRALVDKGSPKSAKKTRDAAKKKEDAIASAIAGDLHKVLKASANLDPKVQTAIRAALVRGAVWGAANGALTPIVVKDLCKRWDAATKVVA